MPDAVVVVGARLDEELLQRGGAGVAAGAGEGKRRRLVVQHVDGVLGRGGHQPGAGALHLEVVEAVLLHHEGSGEGAVLGGGQFARQRVVAPQVGARGGNRGEGAQVDAGSAQHRDVAAVVDGTVRKPGVGREVVHQLEPVHVRQDLHIDSVQVRLHARGAHEILGDVFHAEEHHFEIPDIVLARVTPQEHGQGAEFTVGAGAQKEFCLHGVETQVARRDAQIRAARDGDVARGNLDGVGVDFRRVRRGREQCRGAGAQEGRPGEEDDEDGECDARDGRGPAQQRRPLDPVSAIHGARLADRGLHEPLHERGRVRLTRGLGVGSRVDRAQDRSLQGWLVLLQIERDLRVGRPPPERAHEEPDSHHEQREPGEDAEAGDDRGAEAAAFHPPGGHQEGDQPDPEQRGQSAQRDAHAPAGSHVSNGVEKLESGAVVESCRHLCSPFSGAMPARPRCSLGLAGGLS